jgi:protein-disulfide isomerase
MNAGVLATVLVSGLGIGGTVGYFVGLDQGKAQGVPLASVLASSQPSEVFRVGSRIYKTDELDSQFQSRLYNTERECYQKMEAVLKEYALRIALSNEKGQADPQKVAPLEQLLPPVKVTEEEMKEVFEQNIKRLPPKTKFEDVKPSLEQFLAQQEQARLFQETFNSYAKSGKIKLLVEEPIAPFVSIPVDDYPQQGNAKAENVLVEFSDYLCPHCQEEEPEVKKAIAELGDEIRFVQIDFALRPSKLSGSLIEGAYCAAQQGQEQFWKYHNKAFEGQWGNMNDTANLERPAEIAKAAGIDAEKLSECLKGPEPKAFVSKTNDVAGSLGVTGTPTFFLNSRRLSVSDGADLTAQITAELKLANTN